MRFRFSLRELLGFTALAALGCGGLLHPSEYADSFAFTFTVIALFVAVLGAIAKRGSARMFWLGFAVAGWGYLWAAHWADDEAPFSSGWQLQTSGPLLTTRLLRAACLKLHPPSAFPGKDVGMFSVGPERAGQTASTLLLGRSQLARPVVDYESTLAAFMRVGHSLWTLIFAYLGGRLTRYFYTTATPPGQDRQRQPLAYAAFQASFCCGRPTVITVSAWLSP